ncbi:MAG: SHOCT domain-containing protein [Anaerolineae bacterium]|nr:SHOCT domain-containing protein [Anaerolineae bacterium]
MYGYDGGHMFWGGGVVMLGFWLAAILLVIWGIGLLFSRPQPTHHQYTPPPTEDAEAIVKRRYAHGEIVHDEYLAILKDLHTPNGGRS